MPVWHEETAAWVKQGKLVVLAVIQEQHPRRCRLFAQWKQLDWPILVDPINVMGCGGVPIVVAIDEHGVVRSVRPKMETFERDFIRKTFPPPDAASKATPPEAASKATPPEAASKAPPPEATLPDLAVLRRLARQEGSAGAWRRLGDGLALWGGVDRIDEAIAAYASAVRLAPLPGQYDDGDAHFRLGACYRTRFDSARRKANDFQAAVDHWSLARSIRPNQYIWRRRIEQYGPRLIKPYPFYDWVKTAEAQITARGQRPIALHVALSGAEIAHPSRDFNPHPQRPEDLKTYRPPDPQDRIHHDAQGLIVVEVAVVPPRIAPGESTRVHVTLRPRAGGPGRAGDVHWNNEAQPLVLWIDPPKGWQVRRRLLTAPQGNRPETAEPRHLEFEARAPGDAGGEVELPAYTLYYVCEDAGGTCRFLRQDIKVIVKVGK